MKKDKILGIDTGTNSLGWAIVERDEQGCKLLEKGVNIFQEGALTEKGQESSKAAERTRYRALRTRYYRIKLRKIRLLAVLSNAGLCPPLSREELRLWRLKGIYPQNEAFRAWQATDDRQDLNPYHCRHLCLHERLNLSDDAQRHTLGRALYHINQRRGFLSNRKDQTDDKESGKVKGGISQLTANMKTAGCEYLGDYFYALYRKGLTIRNHYTARNEHYLKEVKAICARQNLPDDLCRKIEKAIFSQRPLKSQKQQVGHCVFEKNKPRCPVSHPLFEEFRMLSFVNNIRVKTPTDDTLRPLNEEERHTVLTLFDRVKERFDFADIANKIAGKGCSGYYKTDTGMPYLFNYHMDSSVPGCPVTARLKKLFGADWADGACEVYTLAKGKTRAQVADDVWHALFFYSDEDKLREFGQSRLQLTEEEAEAFSRIKMPSDYASLSLCAIKKILPYLRQGLQYAHAAFMANLGKVMPAYEWGNPMMREAAIERVKEKMANYDAKTAAVPMDIYLKDFLAEQYHIDKALLSRLYHPSQIDVFPKAMPDDEGQYRLGSPRTGSIRNPMAMRALFRLRHLVNRLLREGKIDRDTTIHIEFARELNDANMRAAIANTVRDNEKEREQCRKEIRELYFKETGLHIEPTDTDILKCQLWNEQGRQCLYTGKQINIADFIGASPKFDIEHTVPRSVGGDSTKMNLTLCDSRYNRDVKKAQLPTALPDYATIMERVADWKEKYERLAKDARKCRTNSSMTKEQKDREIRRRHYLELQRDYWKGKYERFTMTEVPEGFSRRQGTDIGIISKYARLYLKSVFPKVYTIKGIATSDFRKIWGIQSEYTKKERVSHVHHCIDAIVIACLGPGEYSKLAAYYHDEEKHNWYGHTRPQFDKPWPTFTEDLKNLHAELLVSHHTPDNVPKRVVRNVKTGGTKTRMACDTARSQLHKETYYGAIQTPEGIRYVLRKELSSLAEKDIDSIVDETVRRKVKEAIERVGFKEAMAGTIWMNEEKRIPIKRVRCLTSIKNPLSIRRHRDASAKEHKRTFYVTNDSNYLMAIYIGRNGKGKEERDFKVVNDLDAAAFFKRKHHDGEHLVPLVSEKGYPLAYTLKTGTMVLLYESNPEEVWNATQEELSRRLYKVTGLNNMVQTQKGKTRYYSVLKLLHQQEARKSSDIKPKNGAYKQGEALRPGIVMLHTQINALVSGVDFEMNELGEIKWLRR